MRLSPTSSEREELLERYYRPHHARLTLVVDEALRAHGRALIIDGHSFPNKPLPVDLDQSSTRPDICLGTDNFHTPKELIDVFTNARATADSSVAVDRPYAGKLVPSKHYRRDPRVMSMMVEVNRRLYLVNEPEDDSKSASWPVTRDAILASIQEAVATARKIMPQTNAEIGI